MCKFFSLSPDAVFVRGVGVENAAYISLGFGTGRRNCELRKQRGFLNCSLVFFVRLSYMAYFDRRLFNEGSGQPDPIDSSKRTPNDHIGWPVSPTSFCRSRASAYRANAFHTVITWSRGLTIRKTTRPREHQ